MQKFLVAFGRLNWQLWIFALVLISSQPAWADTKLEDKQKESLAGDQADIPKLNEIELPARSARILVQMPTNPPQQGQGGVVSITSVKANPTDKGVEIILQTTVGDQLQVTNLSTGNNFIADVIGAQLRLPSGDAFTFRSQKPLAGVTEITVTNVDANTVRVTVVGENSQPTVELFDDDAGLVFGVAPAITATQPPQQPEMPQKPEPEKPTSQTKPEEPTAQQDEPIELVVTGEQDGYRVPNTTTGTRTDTPLRDIPQSIQVVPRQVIEDQQVTRVGDALQNVSGIQRIFGSSRAQFDRFIIRGFDGSLDGVLRNGVRDRSNARIPSETANIERVDVLKGPASVLYSQGSLGGTVNVVTKQPLRDPFYAVEGVFGNYDFYRGAIDLSGPLNSNKTLLYRLNAAIESSGSFFDFLDRQRYFISPVLSWQIGERTKLTLDAEYVETQQPDDLGLPVEGTVLNNPNGKIPKNRFLGEPESQNNWSAFRFGYNFEHRFSENWQVRNTFRSTLLGREQILILPTALLDDKRRVARSYAEVEDSYTFNTYALDTYVIGKFKTGSIQHQLVTGIDFSREDAFLNFFSRSIDPIDVFNPVYGQRPGRFLSRTNQVVTLDILGIYLQDQITLAENLKLLLGGRFDIANRQVEDYLNRVNTGNQQNEAFSPRVGIVYQPIPALSLYASYSRSFSQIIGTGFDTEPFQPERGTQYELGIKADLSNTVSATLAFYDLTRSNVLTPDPRNTLFSIQTGKQRSRGIEFDISGEILPGWNIIAGYAYTDAEVTEDRRFANNQLNNVPKHDFNLWTTYEVQSGSLQGLGFGVGLFYVGERLGDLANTFELPSYLRTDAAIFYKRDRLRVALNFRNLFDIDYFESSSSRTQVFLGDPFTVQGTISWQL